MPLLPRKGILAIAAVIDIALNARGRPVAAKALATRHSLPPRHLEPVLQALVRHGILKGVRGPRGGYELARTPAELTIGDVVRAIEGPTALGGSELRGHGTSKDVLRDALSDLSRSIESCLDEVTLADLCTRAEQRGVARSSAARYVYAI
jgi:Rrf2 family protein